ncbi:MAG: HEAT repeat domain-containing protein [Myxococcota bacterium]
MELLGPPSGDLTHLLERFQSGTGMRVKKTTATVSSGLLTIWERTMKAAARGGGGHLAAEDIYDEVEEANIQIGSADAAFLIRVASEPSVASVFANTAIRLLGMLAEESLISRSEVLPSLRDLLVHDDTQRRYYAAKALWQARDRDAVAVLRRRLDREPSEEVSSILQRAIAVLE